MDDPGSQGGDGLPAVDDVLAHDEDLHDGDHVGEYVVREKVGEGGFGTVFRAVQPLIDKEVAIKVLKRQYSSDRDIVSRFIAEARAVNQIQHRHIIDIFSFGKLADGRQYYVMNFLRGRALAELIAPRGTRRLAFEEARPILRAVADALDAAHAQNIAHRDLKPENVFICDDGRIKLLDFGIAKLMADDADHKTETGAPIGTPYYMSPQQARGRNVDHRTDVYSFGVMAYQLLTSQLPFTGSDFMDIVLQHIQEPPPAPSSKFAGLSEDVDRALLWILAKAPDARPQSVGDAMRALDTAMGFEPEDGPLPAPLATTMTTKGAGLHTPTAMDDTLQSDDALGATLPSSPPPPVRSPRWPLFAGALAVIGAAAFFGMTRESQAPVAAPTESADAAPLPPPTSAPEVSPPPETAPAARVELDLEITPANAEVSVDGVVTPSRRIELEASDREHELLVRAPGYKDMRRTFKARTSGVISVQLARITTPSPRPRARPRSKASSRVDAGPRKPVRGSRNTDL